MSYCGTTYLLTTQIQMMALTQALAVGVRIEYLDGRNFRGQLDQIVLPEGMEAQINLLYRYVGTMMLSWARPGKPVFIFL